MFSSKRESRKFIDLLLETTNKWVNIDVGKEVKVGDYGTIEKSTGEFLVEGNLYSDALTREAMSNHPVIRAAGTRTEKYTSKYVREHGFAPKVTGGVTAFAELSFESSWEFSRKRGALLLLVSPHMEYMRGFPSLKSADVDLAKVLKNKAICTDVTRCRAFCLYFANSNTHTFNVSFNATSPLITSIPGVDVGAGLGVSWNVGDAHGIVKEGSNIEPVFYPLYTLKTVSWGRVGAVTRGNSGPRKYDADILEPVKKPWANLDDDGQEVPWVQADSDESSDDEFDW